MRRYYYNESSGETSWDKPAAAPASAPAPAPAPEPAAAAAPASSGALPAGWEAVTTPEGETYYFHAGSGETSWDVPGGAEEAAPAAAAAAAAVEEAAAAAPAAGGGGALPAGWEAFTSEGETYYAHADGRTSWDLPTE